jgi:hypothetical protein
MTSMTMDRLGLMTTTQDDRLTVAEAARRLDMDVDAVLELVYSNKLPARVESSTGRVMLGRDDVNRVLRELRAREPRS